MEDGALPTPSRDAVDSDIRHAGVNGGKPGVPTVSVRQICPSTHCLVLQMHICYSVIKLFLASNNNNNTIHVTHT